MSLSQPEFAAEGKTIGALVYFSSASENTARFVAGCRLQDEGINVYRIPLRAADPALNVREPYVIMVPTYGGGVVKKRVGLAGRGKRGGARTLVATNKGDLWFFVFGFEKNERANISAEEKEALQTIAQDLLSRTGKELDAEVEDGSLQEICHDDKD